MAEGWAHHLKSDVIDVWSAGVEARCIDPLAVRVMAEAGVDISGQYSKNIVELTDIEFDYIVTLCGHAREPCPVFPDGSKKIHVGFEDPPKLAEDAATEEDALAHYRRIRDEIRAFVEQLPDALLNENNE